MGRGQAVQKKRPVPPRWQCWQHRLCGRTKSPSAPAEDASPTCPGGLVRSPLPLPAVTVVFREPQQRPSQANASPRRALNLGPKQDKLIFGYRKRKAAPPAMWEAVHRHPLRLTPRLQPTSLTPPRNIALGLLCFSRNLPLDSRNQWTHDRRYFLFARGTIFAAEKSRLFGDYHALACVRPKLDKQYGCEVRNFDIVVWEQERENKVVVGSCQGHPKPSHATASAGYRQSAACRS